MENRFSGKVPTTYTDLISIKGIGQYTANAILCLSHNQKLPLVDASVSRLFSRHFKLITDKPAYSDKYLWALATELLPNSNFRDYNLGLLDIGAFVIFDNLARFSPSLRIRRWLLKRILLPKA